MLVSPLELHEAAKRIMLNGKDPVDDKDWAKLVNFYSVNIAPEAQPSALLVMCAVMKCPLSEEHILLIGLMHCLERELGKEAAVLLYQDLQNSMVAHLN